MERLSSATVPFRGRANYSAVVDEIRRYRKLPLRGEPAVLGARAHRRRGDAPLRLGALPPQVKEECLSRQFFLLWFDDRRRLRE